MLAVPELELIARTMQSLTRVRDIRDQLVQLCERVEIFVEGNPNAADILPVQKAICAGCARIVLSSRLLTDEYNL